MRRSEFFRAVEAEFGSRRAFLLDDVVLPGLGGLTANAALEAGVPPREVWLALAEQQDVPLNRRYGVGRREPKK